MNKATRGPLLPWISLLTIWIVWGSTYLGMSAAVETIPPFIMTAMRFFLAAPILLLITIPEWKRGDIHLTQLQVRNACTIGILLLLGGTGLGALAQRYLDSSFAALLVSLAPIWMAIFASLKTRTLPKPPVIGALFVGLIGIGIMVGGPGAGHISMTGVVIVLISSFAWCYGTVESRYMELPENAFLSSAIQMLAGGIALMILAIFFGEYQELSIAAISTKSWIGFIWLVIGGSLIAYTAYMYANRTLPIEIVSTYAYVNPVIAVLLGASLDGDPIGPNVLIGGGVILSAVIFIVSGHVSRRGPIKQTG